MDAAHLATIIAGEAGTCGMLGMIAVAWVYSRNSTMYGRGVPGYPEYWVANNWHKLPDITGGRRFVFSDQDMMLKSVKKIVKIEGRAPPIVINCKKGQHIWIW